MNRRCCGYESQLDGSRGICLGGAVWDVGREGPRRGQRRGGRKQMPKPVRVYAKSLSKAFREAPKGAAGGGDDSTFLAGHGRAGSRR